MKFKKITSILLTAVCVMSLAACGSKGDSESGSGSDSKGGEDAGSSASGAKVIDIDLTEEEYAFGVDKTQPELLEQVNAFRSEERRVGKEC